MSELTTYTFLPWLRQGVANQITSSEGIRPTIPIELRIQGKDLDGGSITSINVPKNIQIYGPGDITGIDKKSIIKVEPHHWITNFEPNYLPYIEFYDEDLPWRYSPLPNPSGSGASLHRLPPWITLIVLKEDEFEENSKVKDAPLPSIKFTGTSASDFLPPSNELWAWAHVHINQSIINTITSESPESIQNNLGSALNQNPDLAYSRLICPRRLVEKTAYHAFLVPVFESGRLAALGENPNAVSVSQKAWSDSTIPQAMPYFHRWYFRTGAVGDFEYLVRLLKPQPVDSRVGLRDMDVQKPGANIKGILDEDLGGILKLGGALQIPKINYTDDELLEVEKYENWASPYPHVFQESLAAFINLTDDYQTDTAAIANQNTAIDEESYEEGTENDDTYSIGDNPDPIITAPLYGRWHALTQRLLKSKSNNPVPNNTNWVHELNLDPRWRVTAGLGTKVVQENQEDYMKSAWEQLGDVLEANKKIRAGQLVLMVTQMYYESHLGAILSQDENKWLSLSYPISKRILMDNSTIFHAIKQSKLPQAALSTSMRKFIRPRGKLSKRLSNIPLNDLVKRLNNGEITAAPPKTTPEGAHTLNDIAELLHPNNLAALPELFENMIKIIPECRSILGVALELIFPYLGDARVCIQFNRLKGPLKAPYKYKNVVVQTFDFKNNPSSELTITSFGNNLIGLLAEFRVEIKLIKPTNWMSITYSTFSSPPTFIVIDVAGNVIDKKTQEPTESSQTFEFSGKDIIQLIVENPGGETLIHQFCYQSEENSGNQQEKIKNAALVLGTSQTPDIVKSFPSSNNFTLLDPKSNTQADLGGNDNQEAKEFKEALFEANTMFTKSAEFGEIPVKPSLSIQKTSQVLYKGLNPQVTVPRWIWGGIFIPERIRVNLINFFVEAMAYPEFDMPMYKPLVEYSDELFLPGLNYIAQNSISLLETNQKFIESYMVGLNHEFARELLWREYPTDQRGSYFRQFWDVKSYLDTEDLDQEELKEKLKDIPPIHKWFQNSDLGSHDHREEGGAKEEEVVLVIRGELLKKYPNAVIYAHKAQWQYKKDDDDEFILDEEGKKIIDLTRERELVPLSPGEEENPPKDKIKTPLYEAKVNPDIYFFGFDLTACAAKGGAGKEDDPIDPACEEAKIPWDDPGWFFVIKERPGEPRFGLDIGDGGNIEEGKIEVWNDLSWGDLNPAVEEDGFIQVAGQQGITADQTLELGGNNEEDDQEKIKQQTDDLNVTWSADMSSSELAYILYQVPVLVAIHASEMLPTN